MLGDTHAHTHKQTNNNNSLVDERVGREVVIVDRYHESDRGLVGVGMRYHNLDGDCCQTLLPVWKYPRDWDRTRIMAKRKREKRYSKNENKRVSIALCVLEDCKSTHGTRMERKERTHLIASRPGWGR